MKTKVITRDKWIWMGHPGHFICSRDCRFFMCTKVGKYLISTVGEYLPDYQIREIMAESRKVVLEGKGDARLADYMKKIGYEDLHFDGWKYETMVFPIGKRKVPKGDETCCPYSASNWRGLDEIYYKTGKEAFEGHYKMCSKWARK